MSTGVRMTTRHNGNHRAAPAVRATPASSATGRSSVPAFDDFPVPLYEKVKQFITDGIRAGEWEAGGRLPSEIDLVEKLGVSRMTVHRALRELMATGIVVRLQGVGTFVSRNKP